MTDVLKWSAGEAATAIRTGQISVQELTQAHIARMKALDPALNVITHEVDDALDLARAMDAQGIPETAGPLWGVPVTVKVNVDMAGYPTDNGIPAFKDMNGAEDSAVVRSLKDSGAVIIGRTNAPEFSMRWLTSNPLHGQSMNPWHEDITPGGSSGGAAAAVATGIGAIAHGNDLGGSLRFPAYCCGVATIRPSFGRVAGVNPNAQAERPALLASMSVNGPIARSIADVRLGLEAMSARDSRDPWQSPARSSGRPRGTQITIGIAADPFETRPHPAVQTAVETARRAAEAAGFAVRDVTLPDADEAVRIWGALVFTETEIMSRAAMNKVVSPELQRVLDAYADHFDLLDAAGLLRAMQRRMVLQRQWSLLFDALDLVLLPTSLAPPFPQDQDIKSPETVPDIMRAIAPMSMINLLGLPAAALPTHLQDGVPQGVQLVGPLHDDDFVLDAAQKLEAELGTLWQMLPQWR